MKIIKPLLGIAVSAVALAGMTANATVTTYFGSLPQATFGGTGIPNNAVEVTTITDGQNTITLGLEAMRRYGPALPNDGNNPLPTYYAAPGLSSPGTPPGATWNFNTYVGITGGGNLGTYTFILEYALTPSGTPFTTPTGWINLNNAVCAAGGSPTLTVVQDSENLNFGIFGTSVPGIISAPPGPFNPNATGNYTFVLKAFKTGNVLLGQSEIDVQVVPEPTTMIAGALLLLPFGLSAFRSLRKSVQA